MLALRVRMVGPVRMVSLDTRVTVFMVMSAPTVKQVYQSVFSRMFDNIYSESELLK